MSIQSRLNDVFELERQDSVPSDALLELLSDHQQEEESPLFIALKEKLLRESGGPSRQRGSGDRQQCLFPPLDNMGVTKHGNDNPTNTKPVLGGYDGGLELGFTGEWDNLCFHEIITACDEAKKCAEESGHIDDCYVKLGQLDFLVKPHGGGRSVHYRYILEGHGLKLYIHHNPQKNIQPIRVRYNFEAVLDRDVFELHRRFRGWIKDMGFHVKKETISRVDLQVMTFRDIWDYGYLIFSNHAVMRAASGTMKTKHQKLETYTAGKSTQICIYNKRQELLSGGDEAKRSLMIEKCFCGELPEHVTRIEFRLRRESLKYLGIDTMEELEEKEVSLAEFLTSDWFRLLSEPKKKGHEYEQAVHPLWKEVQGLFREYFPGRDRRRSDVERGLSRRKVNCSSDQLLKQAVGCLSTMVARTKGVMKDPKKILLYVIERLEEHLDFLSIRSRERAVSIGIIRGMEAPDSENWELNPAHACDFEQSSDRDYWLYRVPVSL